MKFHLASLSFLVVPYLATAEWEWKRDGHRSVELLGEEGALVRFLVDPAPRDPHFDLLATPDGRNLVWVAPSDHRWHYGLWFSWKLINGVNFWETGRSGASRGRTEVLDSVIVADKNIAAVRYRRLYRLPEADDPVMEDKVVLHLRPPRDGGGPQVDWSITTRAFVDVELGRTPLPGEPGGKAHGGYGGFSWRGARDLAKVRFLDSEGRVDMKGHRKHARWMNATGNLDGKPAGIALFDHPDNPGHPTSWYLVHRTLKHGPFWYMNPALLQPKPLRLKKGGSFTHRYRALVHDGALDPAALDAKAKAFAREADKNE